MGLVSLMATDISRLFTTGDGAKSIIYSAPDGTRTTITANVYDKQTVPQEVRGIATLITTRIVQFRISELASINMRGTLLIDNDEDEWAINTIAYQDDLTVSLEVQKHELHEHTRPGYRRQ